MNFNARLGGWVAGLLLAAATGARAQSYVGFVYPAGGQQGTTFQVTIGGQGLEGVDRVFVSGPGVRARVAEYNKKMNPQEVQLLSEQLREIRNPPDKKPPDPAHTNLIARLEKLIREHVQQPACSSIANLIIAEITIEKYAEPGPRELRIRSNRGISNPLVFMIGQVPEYAGPPVPTSHIITLGKEGASLRRKPKKPAPVGGGDMMMMMMGGGGDEGQSDLDDEEIRINLPCTVNGQITSGTVDRFRFSARKGQKVVVAVHARELVPYMADAVPGWFQPVVAIRDARGREVAYGDDFRFKPDPTLPFEVPADGEYLLSITDAIFRGREDFVYRATIGEMPFIAAAFPLGGPSGAPTTVEVRGWNLEQTRIENAVPKDAPPGIHWVAARGRGGLVSNRIPIHRDDLPECAEKEPNNGGEAVHRLTPPVIVNGLINGAGDRDVFEIPGAAGASLAIEVLARRLDSPLDSIIKVTDAAGATISICDDVEDPGTGLNTHHADARLVTVFPSNGVYRVVLSDTQHAGGPEFGYRLRISPPRPDFALRVVPSGLTFRSNNWASATVHLIRQDGFKGPVRLRLASPTNEFEMGGVTFSGTQATARVSIKAKRGETFTPVSLKIEGVATNAGQTIVRQAVGAEDRMQAFLWRHLVPAQELAGIVLPPPPPPPGTMVAAVPPAPPPKPAAPAPAPKTEPPKPATTPTPPKVTVLPTK
jgi:hypothetical protein